MKERWDHWVETAAGLGIEISPGNECQAVAKKSLFHNHHDSEEYLSYQQLVL